MYLWRKLTPKQRDELMAFRHLQGLPWHSLAHRAGDKIHYLLTAACFKHRPIIGKNPERMAAFSETLLKTVAPQTRHVVAWCVLPNHYHALVEAPDINRLLHQLGLFHGRTSYAWNGEENIRGHKVFFRAVERAMRSDRHYFATLNYVHYNPVRHGYVERWTDWPRSSGKSFLQMTGFEEANRIWRDYPIREYGKEWDEPRM